MNAAAPAEQNAFAHVGPECFAKNVAVIKNSYGAEVRVDMRKGYHKGAKVYRFVAPGWRPMRFFDPCKAAAKMASHYNFVRWEA